MGSMFEKVRPVFDRVDGLPPEFGVTDPLAQKDLAALWHAIIVCAEFEEATVLDAAELMRSQRIDDVLRGREEDGGMDVARWLEVEVSTRPIVRYYETAVNDMLSELRDYPDYDTVRELVADIYGGTMWPRSLRFRAELVRMSNHPDWRDSVVEMLVGRAMDLADAIRANDLPELCPTCGGSR